MWSITNTILSNSPLIHMVWKSSGWLTLIFAKIPGWGEAEGSRLSRQNCQGLPYFGFHWIFIDKSFEICFPPSPPPPFLPLCAYMKWTQIDEVPINNFFTFSWTDPDLAGFGLHHQRAGTAPRLLLRPDRGDRLESRDHLHSLAPAGRLPQALGVSWPRGQLACLAQWVRPSHEGN
jgi:hypothetical protein